VTCRRALEKLPALVIPTTTITGLGRVTVISSVVVVGLRIQFREGRKAGDGSED
jgi:hypothetical protein